MALLRVFIPSVLLLLSVSACQAQTINQKVVSFLHANHGHQVGGGECAHAVTEALRASGAAFMSTDLGADFPAPGDYVWGTLVKVISVTNLTWTDSNPGARIKNGDILQYRNATIVLGNGTWSATHHTAVAAGVNSRGMPTHVFEQNANSVRLVTKDPIDLTKLVAGWIRVYRPIARVDKPGRYEFSLVNNMTSQQSVAVKFGSQSLGSVSLGSTNTASSYVMEVVSSSSPTAKFTLMLSNGNSIQIDNAAGYQVLNGTLQKLSP